VLRLENRDGGGLAVHVRLPGRSAVPDGVVGKLSLTRSDGAHTLPSSQS